MPGSAGRTLGHPGSRPEPFREIAVRPLLLAHRPTVHLENPASIDYAPATSPMLPNGNEASKARYVMAALLLQLTTSGIRDRRTFGGPRCLAPELNFRQVALDGRRYQVKNALNEVNDFCVYICTFQHSTLCKAACTSRPRQRYYSNMSLKTAQSRTHCSGTCLNSCLVALQRSLGTGQRCDLGTLSGKLLI